MNAPAPLPVTTAHALWTGEVSHRRHGPRPHAFRYGVWMLGLDADDLADGLRRALRGRWLWSSERFNLVSVHRRDYLGPVDLPLGDAVRGRVEDELGFTPAGPVVLLANARALGVGFNPVSIYFCGGVAAPEAIVLEVSNTPWLERHSYVLDCRGQQGELRFEVPKAFHVSPFMPMAQAYRFRFHLGADRLVVDKSNVEDGRVVFHARLALERQDLTGRAMARALASRPLMAWQVVLGIYWQALRLFLKRTPFHGHPQR